MEKELENWAMARDNSMFALLAFLKWYRSMASSGLDKYYIINDEESQALDLVIEAIEDSIVDSKNKNSSLPPITKTERTYIDGKTRWQEKVPEPILNCACGKKYIKTRVGQETCIFCMVR